ncbi:MAG: membrane protein insertion efficiency factor YidD [Planctomycetes bacterium]|nr:membrane protein insertion efficiency factor YidD [Planctomycetota bacterium]
MTRLLVLLITTYRWTLGLVLPNTCNYTPSCSMYAIEALRRRGLLIGTWLAVRRILRCHPWGGHGYDPVVASVPPCSEERPQGRPGAGGK